MVEKTGGMRELAKICPNCGKNNKIIAKFCENCGTTLNEVSNTSEQDNTQKSEQSDKPSNIFDQIKNFWNARDTKGKAVTGVAACCVGLLIIGVIGAALFPDKTISVGFNNATYDGSGNYHIDVDNSTTEYVINGYTEAGTNLTVSSTDLNISAQRVNLTSSNGFTYKVKIPKNVNSVTIRFDAVKAGKDNSSAELTIKKTSTQVSSSTTNTTPTTTQTTSTTPTTTADTPKTVTIAQLYGSSIPVGTHVKVTGTVLQSDGYNLRIENSEDQDILVEGDDVTAYEDQSVTVVGTYDGPTSYTTVMGGERTVPCITDAQIVK